MDKEVRYYEVEITFKAPNGAVIPVTATSEQEAKEIAQYLFREYDDLDVKSVRDISTNDSGTPISLLN